MTPKELGLLFESIAQPDENGISREFLIADLAEQHNPAFRTTNGSQWSRNNGYLGRKYNIIKTYKSGRVYSIKLNGFNQSIEYHNIPTQVRDYYKNQSCVFTGCNVNIEIDHKDARYTQDTTELDAFQPVCKMMNDIKREICKKCRTNKCRPRGSSLGFLYDFIKGDENSEYCEGCYYYDPIQFRKGLSK